MPALAGVKPALGWYVPLPETDVVAPTAVPPVQVVGALSWGPKTLNVIEPPAPALEEPDRTALIEWAEIAVPVVSASGASARSLGWATVVVVATVVEVVLVAADVVVVAP